MKVLLLVGNGSATDLAFAIGSVTAIGVLAPDRRGPLAALRQRGAERVVAIWDETLNSGSDLSIAQLLAEFARQHVFDLIVAGAGRRGVIGPMVAERLALPHLSRVIDARFDGSRLVARRRAGGTIRTYVGSVPAVVCGVGGAGPVQQVEDDEIDVLHPDALGVSAIEIRWGRRLERVPAVAPKAAPLLFSNVRALTDRLVHDGLLMRRP